MGCLSCVGWKRDVGKVAVEVFEIAGDAYHGSIVGAELERGNEHFPVVTFAKALQFTAQ
jgi:hypothetical protein